MEIWYNTSISNTIFFTLVWMHALLRTQKYKALLNNFLLHAVNSDECIMTRIQEMSLDYHFSVEQEVGSSTYSFFGFNGKLVYRLTKLHL